MIQKNIHSVPVFQFEKLSGFSEIIHFVSTRKGGVSMDHLESLNLGSRVGDNPAFVLENKKRLANEMGFNMGQFVFPVQTHENRVRIITYDLVDEINRPGSKVLDNTDALITNISGVCLCILIADCVPILFYDPVENVIAATHAGWHGTVKNISGTTVNLMVNEFKCNPSNILACVGPSIGPDIYEVGEEVIPEVIKAFNTTEKILIPGKLPGKAFLNLWNANKIQITEAGIPGENIEICGICTFSNPDLFFSSRKTNGKTGRFGAGIMML